MSGSLPLSTALLAALAALVAGIALGALLMAIALRSRSHGRHRFDRLPGRHR